MAVGACRASPMARTNTNSVLGMMSPLTVMRTSGPLAVASSRAPFYGTRLRHRELVVKVQSVEQVQLGTLGLVRRALGAHQQVGAAVAVPVGGVEGAGVVVGVQLLPVRTQPPARREAR